MGNKKKQPSVQGLIFNYKETSIIPSSPHAGKSYSQPRVLSGRGFGKTCIIRIADGKPVVIGNQNGINIKED